MIYRCYVKAGRKLPHNLSSAGFTEINSISIRIPCKSALSLIFGNQFMVLIINIFYIKCTLNFFKNYYNHLDLEFPGAS